MDTLYENKIENSHKLNKYHWQVDHKPNATGTSDAYKPNKNKNVIKKNIRLGRVKILNLILFILILATNKFT